MKNNQNLKGKKMTTSAVSAMVTTVINLLPDEIVKEFLDAGFDKIENVVKDSSNRIDDVVILPIINKLRSAFDVPDNDVVETGADAEIKEL